MNEPEDDVTDAEADRFFGAVALSMRVGVARGLLRGNDTGCFSTEDYRAAYDRAYPLPTVPPELKWFFTTPEAHLRSIPGTVREVAPGVWAGAREGVR